MRKTFLPRTALGIIILVLFVSAALAIYRRPGSVSLAPAIPTTSSTPATVAPVAVQTQLAPPAGYLEYQSAHYRFSLLYPGNLVVADRDEGGGERTVSFESSDAMQGFQIFVVPYSESQISPERFKLDEPSLVRDQPTDIQIAGTPAVMFFSKNTIMGDTAEVWFIRGGYLYEVTTYKESADWLGQIMQTWQFI